MQTLVCIWAGLIGVFDLLERRIPNPLLLLAASLSIGVLIWTGSTPLGETPLAMFSGLLVANCLTLPGYLSRRLGAGDVKFLMAVAAVGGVSLTLQAFIVGTLLAVCIGGFWMLFSYRLGAVSISGGQRVLPFGSALALGVILGVLHGHLEFL